MIGSIGHAIWRVDYDQINALVVHAFKRSKRVFPKNPVVIFHKAQYFQNVIYDEVGFSDILAFYTGIGEETMNAQFALASSMAAVPRDCRS